MPILTRFYDFWQAGLSQSSKGLGDIVVLTLWATKHTDRVGLEPYTINTNGIYKRKKTNFITIDLNTITYSTL